MPLGPFVVLLALGGNAFGGLRQGLFDGPGLGGLWTWRPAFFIYGLMVPTLALAGYVSGGNQVLRDASADADFVVSAGADANVTPQTAAAADRLGTIGLGLAGFRFDADVGVDTGGSLRLPQFICGCRADPKRPLETPGFDRRSRGQFEISNSRACLSPTDSTS